jgi:hypothetical protein
LTPPATLLSLKQFVKTGMYRGAGCARRLGLLPSREGAPLFVGIWAHEVICVYVLLGRRSGVHPRRRRTTSFQASMVVSGSHWRLVLRVAKVFGVSTVSFIARVVSLILSGLW